MSKCEAHRSHCQWQCCCCCCQEGCVCCMQHATVLAQPRTCAVVLVAALSVARACLLVCACSSAAVWWSVKDRVSLVTLLRGPDLNGHDESENKLCVASHAEFPSSSSTAVGDTVPCGTADRERACKVSPGRPRCTAAADTNAHAKLILAVNVHCSCIEQE